MKASKYQAVNTSTPFYNQSVLILTTGYCNIYGPSSRIRTSTNRLTYIFVLAGEDACYFLITNINSNSISFRFICKAELRVNSICTLIS